MLTKQDLLTKTRETLAAVSELFPEEFAYAKEEKALGTFYTKRNAAAENTHLLIQKVPGWLKEKTPTAQNKLTVDVFFVPSMYCDLFDPKHDRPFSLTEPSAISCFFPVPNPITDTGKPLDPQVFFHIYAARYAWTQRKMIEGGSMVSLELVSFIKVVAVWRRDDLEAPVDPSLRPPKPLKGLRGKPELRESVYGVYRSSDLNSSSRNQEKDRTVWHFPNHPLQFSDFYMGTPIRYKSKKDAVIAERVRAILATAPIVDLNRSF